MSSDYKWHQSNLFITGLVQILPQEGSMVSYNRSDVTGQLGLMPGGKWAGTN